MKPGLTTLNSRALTSILVVALPVLVIAAAVVIGVGQRRQNDAQQTQLAQLAQYTASAIDAYVFRRILDAALVARVPDIRRVSREGSAQGFDGPRAEAIDREWQAARTRTPVQAAVLASPASKYLADLVKNDPIYREVLVTDRYGRLVAASNVTSDYLQGDEAWWTAAYDAGRGRVIVTDVRRDESAHVFAFEIAVPVPAPDSDELAGVMKIVADSREMLMGIAGLELGATTEATLVRLDGSIVYRRRAFNEGDRFFGAELMHQRIDEFERRKEPIAGMAFPAQSEDGTRRLVAIAPGQLSRSYPDLQWVVALSVSQDEIAGPFRGLLTYLALVFALTMLAVVGIALWLSMRLAAPAIDPDADLHLVEHPHAG